MQRSRITITIHLEFPDKMKAKFSNDRIWVKVLLQIEIPQLSEDIDIASIRKILNEYVKSLIPSIPQRFSL